MFINYDYDRINKSLTDFYNSTGINMAVFKSDFTYVCENRTHWEKNLYCKEIQNTEEGRKVCHNSDIKLLEKCRDTKLVQTHVCPAGLLDVALPILYDGEIIGYIMFGQLKPDFSVSEIERYISKLGLDVDKMKEYYENIPLYDNEKIDSVSNIASMFVKYILLENLLKPSHDAKTESVLNYIDENISENFTVHEISKNVNLSKSVLYRMFHNNFNCTVSEYINKRRIEKSMTLLTETNMSVEEISQAVGFSSISYYSRMFKKINNTTPLKYKKTSRLA